MPSPSQRSHALRLGAAGALLGCGVIAWLTMRNTGPGSLLPHGYCFTWNPALLWTHVFSDLLIGIAYFSIPLTLLHLVRRRADVPFDGLVLLFATFIVSCGTTHFIHVWTVWNPDYWLSAFFKVITAAASLLTAGALIRLMPRLLAIPTGSQLAAANAALEREVLERRAIEQELLAERASLEERVLERTRALAQATAAAEQANLQKDRFLAKVSHELRTPLQAMLSWSQVLDHDKVEPPRAKHAAERIAHNVRLQARLIDDLLDISRILHGKLHLDLALAEPLALVERAVEVVQARADQAGVHITVLPPHSVLPPLLTDTARLEQVVWNLLSNAVQASAPGSTVRLSFDVQADQLHLRVRDAGVGIAAAQLPLIFEPFRQLGGAAGAHRGLGLGLAIARNIVGLLGGELTASSAGLGQGAEFHLRLPLHPPAARPALQGAPTASAAAPTEALQPDELARLKGLRVVYVEDDEDIAHSAEMALSAMGLRLCTCLDFDTALARLAQPDFDLLLTDLKLDGGHTGTELLQALRRMPHGAQVPAIVLSAYGREDDLRASTNAGFARHLVKPLEATAVARALLAVLGGGP